MVRGKSLTNLLNVKVPVPVGGTTSSDRRLASRGGHGHESTHGIGKQPGGSEETDQTVGERE